MIRAGALASARIVLVDAPVGYGKTRLAELIAAGHDGPLVRVRPLGDGSPAAVADAISHGLRRAGFATDDAAADGDALGHSLDTLVATLGARAGDPALVLLDDAHLLDDATGPAVARAVTDLRPATRAIVCGRRLTPFTDLVLRPDTTRVELDDLRLTAADVRELLGAGHEPTLAEEIVAATHGWPAAVELAIARIRQEPTWSIAGPAGARALLRDLVDTLVAADPDTTRIARLPMYDDRVVAIVLPHRTRTVELPARRLGRWNVVAPTIAGLIAGDPLPAEVVFDVATHYHRSGETGAAVALLRGDAPSRLGDFLGTLRWDELAELGVPHLRGAVAEVSPQDDERYSRLLLDAARAVELDDRALRAVWLEQAASIDASPSTTRAIAAERAREVLRCGEIDRGAELAREVLADAGSSEHATRARALVTIGMAEGYQCTVENLAAAAHAYTEAADLYRRAGETRLLAETLARRGHTAQYLAGHPVDAATSMDEALALLPVGDRTRAFWLTMYSDVLDVLGRTADADAAVREALEIGARRRDPTTSGMAWWTKSWSAALRGDRAGMRAALAEVERHRGAWLEGGQEAEYLGSSAEHLSLVGDLAGYRHYIVAARRSGDEVGYPEVVATPQAYFEAEHGDPETGLRLLDELETLPGVAPVMAPRRLLLRAVALRRCGDAARADAAFAGALELARAMGVPDLLHRMHARQVLTAAGPVDTPPPVPPAHLQLLGRFSLTVAGVDRTPQPGHPAALVKLLAVTGAMTVDAAVDVLWPDAEVSTGRARLRNTLNRLKSRAGVVVVRDGATLRLHESVHVDARSFEQAAAGALSAPALERVGRAQHAIALYPGPLLPGDAYDEWLVADRARLQRRFVSLTDLVADDCIARGDLDEAGRLLDAGIAAEPHDERRALQLCRVLGARGRDGAAREVARHCADALDELGVAPGPALRRYLRST